MDIGTAVKNIRKEAKLKQNLVALESGITQTYLSQIESNSKKPSTEMLERLAVYYRIPISIILWKATDIEDIEEHKRDLFRQIKPLVDSLIDQLLK